MRTVGQAGARATMQRHGLAAFKGIVKAKGWAGPRPSGGTVVSRVAPESSAPVRPRRGRSAPDAGGGTTMDRYELSRRTAVKLLGGGALVALAEMGLLRPAAAQTCQHCEGAGQGTIGAD